MAFTIPLRLDLIHLLGVNDIASPLTSIEVTTAQNFLQTADLTLSGSLMPKTRGSQLYKTRKGNAGCVCACRDLSPDINIDVFRKNHDWNNSQSSLKGFSVCLTSWMIGSLHLSSMVGENVDEDTSRFSQVMIRASSENSLTWN